MKYLIFGSREEAEIKLQNINDYCIANIWNDGITNNYSDIFYNSVENKWGIPVLEGYEFLFNEDELINCVNCDIMEVV
jgi:hypothetical protein